MSNSPQFKSYPEGNLIFTNIKAEKAKKGYPPLFNFNGKEKISSEELGKEYYKSEGYSAVFSENEIWNAFFNQLIYKNIKKLYESGEITTKNYQLFDDEFYRENEPAINDLFNSLMDIDIREYIESNYKNSSKKLTEDRVKHRSNVLKAAEHLENNQILIVMHYMIEDYIHHRRGFPDLMVWRDDEMFFAEIKAGSDVLSRIQISAHKTLLKAGIDVVLLTINKRKSSFEKQRRHYIQQREPAKTDYKGRYNRKLETANKRSEILEEHNDDETLKSFKTIFYDKGINYLIAYLNVLDKQNIMDIEELNINEDDVKKEEKLIQYLDIMSKGKAFEDKNMYIEAVEKYKETAEDKENPRRFTAYYRMCLCYRNANKHQNEIEIIKEIINDDSIPKDKKRRFERRIEKRLKKKDFIKSDILCPKCKEENLKYKNYNRTSTKIYMCENCKHMMID